MATALAEMAPFLVKRSRFDDLPEDLRPKRRDMVRFVRSCDNLVPALDRCVEWRGHFNGRARRYPQFWFRGRNRAARMLTWIWFGDGEPTDLKRVIVKTTCPSHTCVNPTHLKRCISRRRKKPLRYGGPARGLRDRAARDGKPP